jgi:hypothetical protein
VTDTPQTTGIVVYCSDPDAGLWKEVKQHLIKPEVRMAPIGVLGGPISLAHPDTLKIEYHFLLGQIHFALGNKRWPNITSLWLVSHDCGYYKKVDHREFALSEKESDVVKAVEAAKGHFPGLKVKGFFKDPNAAGFKKMT